MDEWRSQFTGDTLSDIAQVLGVKLSELVEECITPVVYSDNIVVKAVASNARKLKVIIECRIEKIMRGTYLHNLAIPIVDPKGLPQGIIH